MYRGADKCYLKSVAPVPDYFHNHGQFHYRFPAIQTIALHPQYLIFPNYLKYRLCCMKQIYAEIPQTPKGFKLQQSQESPSK